MTDLLFGDVYRGRRVLVTGHTGFKGSWLALWLRELGADVSGFALSPATQPNHWDGLGLSITEVRADIRDGLALRAFFELVRPEIVFHLAAQPIVRLSYRQPVETYATNVIGSLNVYEACRAVGTVRAIVSITTDKVYENREWVWGYRESDPLGGHDPYSASKACADLATTSYQRSDWPNEGYGRSHQTLLATARAGNVVGGGDWAEDRLIPDIVRGVLSGTEAVLRHPSSVRPWEHVLDPLAAYLLLGQRLWEGHQELARPWNFGPSSDGVMTVVEVIAALREAWPAVRYRVEVPADAPHEAGLLMLDCSLARSLLGWRPVWDGAETLAKTAAWYRANVERGAVASRQQLREYIDSARTSRAVWVNDEA